MRDRRKTVFVILALTLCFAAYLRFYNLGVPSFWVDELDFVEAAKSKATVGAPLLVSGYAYPRAPILTYSLVAAYEAFGVSEFSSRLPSAVFGLMSIPLIFVIGKRWFDSRVGLVAAIFLATAPFEVGWSRACRMYALFQLLFLAGMFLFYIGFERYPQRTRSSDSEKGRISLLKTWGVDPVCLSVGLVFLYLSYTAHQNAALFVVSFGAYLLAMTLLTRLPYLSRDWFLSKYAILSAAGLCCLGLALLFPAVRDFLTYAIGYQPQWAEVNSAQDPWRIFKFFSGRSHFPMNILFIAGALLVLHRRDRAGIYALLNLLIPVLVFSFVFQYRKNDYIYHVYPVFFLLAAIPVARVVNGLTRWFEAALSGKRALVNYAPLAVALLWLPLTPGFRVAQKVPRLPDGHFNGAIYHNEWKGAARHVGPALSDTDIVISTLPLSVQYYLGRADYNLNWSNADLAREQNIKNKEGRFIDFYSGTALIDNIDDVKEIFSKNQKGWILVDNYRFNNPTYVPLQVSEFIARETIKSFETENKTVSIYGWNRNGALSATN